MLSGVISAHGSPCPRSARRAGLVVGLLTILLFGSIASVDVPRIAAHAELASSDPAADALLTTAPESLALSFTEPVTTGAGSPSVRLIDDQGREQHLTDLSVVPDAPTEVRMNVQDLGPGTYTVAWSVLSDTDGHTLSGSFAFRIGGGRAPTAATVADGGPRAWAVATRWLTFLGAALLAGGAVFALAIAPGALQSIRVARVVAIGAAAGLAATGLEPLLYTRLPPEGVGDPSLRTAFEALPDAWWYRPPAMLLGLGLAIGWWWIAHRGRFLSPFAAIAAGGSGLAALLGLSLTGHGAGRDTWRWLAVGSDVVHQWSIAIWVGALCALVVSGAREDGAAPQRIGRRALIGLGSRGTSDPISRFSRLALPLVVVGVATGVLNAGLVLPAVERLIDSTYGRIILGKVLILLPILLLAAFHRSRIRIHVAGLAEALRPTLRLETGLAIVVVLGGSLLAMLAPPREAASTPQGNGDAANVVDLAAPIDAALGDAGPALHLRVDPVLSGTNVIEVYFGAPARPPAPIERVPFATSTTVVLAFTSFSHAVAPTSAVAAPDGAGGFRVEGLNLSLDGWWRVEAIVRQGRDPEIRRSFELLLGDPNIYGSDAVRLPATDPKAAVVFDRGMAGIAALHRVRYTQRLCDGNGNVALIEFAGSDGSDGSPPSRSQSTARVAIVSIGEREWLQRSDGVWTERTAGVLVPPSEAVNTYLGATSFALGPVEQVGGEGSQIVTFYVPATRTQSEAWFTWWVGTESGHVLREAMVARAHYMLTDYRDFDAPFTIVPPVAADPSATPEAVAIPAPLLPPATPVVATPAPI